MHFNILVKVLKLLIITFAISSGLSLLNFAIVELAALKFQIW
jgi:hypothetical protein